MAKAVCSKGKVMGMGYLFIGFGRASSRQRVGGCPSRATSKMVCRLHVPALWPGK